MNRTRSRRLAALSMLLAVLAAAPAAGESAEPRKPEKGERCPVCGMLVAPHSEWVAQAILADGTAVFFDGSRDLFQYLLGRGETAPDIVATYVTTYYELQVVPAESAFFVAGSDVFGPMGAELVPHASREEAEEFLRDHRGRAVVRFAEVTADVLDGLAKPPRR